MTDKDVRCVRPTSLESPRVALSIFKRGSILYLGAQIAMRDVRKQGGSARRKTRYLNGALYAEILGTYHVLEVCNLPILLKA